jgi:hypothetical protein
LTSIRTGAARIALLAEARADWGLGLRIQPVGLTYERKHLFRGRVTAAYGDPLPVSEYRRQYERDERLAVDELTAEIRTRLEGVTLNFERTEDADLVNVAERIYARAKGLARPRERERMSDRFHRLHRFASGLHVLRDTDPERLERLRQAAERYLRLLTLYGATEGDVPDSYRRGSVIRYAARQTAMLLIVLPAAALGVLYWVVPVFVTRWLASRFRPKLDQIATYKVGAALMVFPVWLAGTCAALWLSGGLRPTVLALVALPMAGLAAIAWREREAIVREDVRVFLRSRRRSESRDRLSEQRAALVSEIDAIVELQAPTGGEGTDSGASRVGSSRPRSETQDDVR